MDKLASTISLLTLLGCNTNTSTPIQPSTTPDSEVGEVVKSSLQLLRRASENPYAEGLTVRGEPFNYTVTEPAKCSEAGAANGFKYNGDCSSQYLCLELMPIRVCPDEKPDIKRIYSLGGFNPTNQGEIAAMYTYMGTIENAIQAGHSTL